MPVLRETPEVWPHQAEFLLGALARILAQLNPQAQQQAIGDMAHFFIWLSPKAFAIHHSHARLAVSLSTKMLMLLRDFNRDWAQIVCADLRQVINADPQNSPFKPVPNPPRLEDCKTQ
jgi:hypothetical protein